MNFRTRHRFSLISKGAGVLFAVGGVTLLLSTMPIWFWFLIAGGGMVALGWYLYFYRS